ncbi:MAG: hypothetical protein KIS61_29255 [Candidatus Eremiobacteraeota bacterium]|nr:hypothetical protein [Candidatus Eremiobacteraeota bacterium]
MNKFGGWHKLASQEEADQLMDRVQHFRDSILRESKFSQGAFVDERLSLNTSHLPHLRCLFQRQKSGPVLEIFFVNVKEIRLLPAPYDPIEEASLKVTKEELVWSDHENVGSVKTSTVTSETAYWREIDGWLGPKERYTAVQSDDLDYYAPELDCELPSPSLRGPGQAL